MSPLVLPPQSYLGWKVSVIVLHAIAVSTTIARLVHRFRAYQAWWDDYVLFIPLVFNLAYWIVFCWGFSRPTGLYGQDDDSTSADAIFDSYWLATLPGIFVWWGTRTVFALSLARLFAPKDSARRWSFILAAIVTILGLAAIVVTIATCDISSALLNQGEFQRCIKGPGGFSMRSIILFAEALGTDVLFVLFTSILTWRLKRFVHEYHIAVAVLLASLITLLYTTAFLIIIDTHVVSMGDSAVLIETGLHNVLTAISLFLCNLPVIVTCLPHWIRHYPCVEITAENAAPLPSPSPSPLPPSFHSFPLSHITLTEISEVSEVTSFTWSRQSEPSIGTSYNSWRASRDASPEDVETGKLSRSESKPEDSSRR